MAKLVFHLNGVPEEEADAVRQALTDADIQYYETHAGRWGLSVAAIWLVDDDDLIPARERIEEVQQGLSRQAQPVPTLLQRIWQRPGEVFAILVAIVLVLALSIWPFLTAFSD